MCLTKNAIHLAFEGEDREIDYIPLAEILSAHDMDDIDIGIGLELDDDVKIEQGAIHIVTEQGGHNSGREYYLRPNKENVETITHMLRHFSRDAKKRRDNFNIFQRAQKKVLFVYESTPSQALVVLMISLVRFFGSMRCTSN